MINQRSRSDLEISRSNKLTFKLQRTANEYAAKRRIYKRPDQQKYTLSRHKVNFHVVRSALQNSACLSRTVIRLSLRPIADSDLTPTDSACPILSPKKQLWDLPERRESFTSCSAEVKKPRLLIPQDTQ